MYAWLGKVGVGMDAVKFLNEYYRLCKTYFNTNRGDKCTGCPFEINDFSCYMEDITTKPEKAVEIVEQWSEEHPQKTYKDDFFEKFPYATAGDKGYPKIDWCELYNDGECPNWQTSEDCLKCWDKEMEEE